MFKKPFFSSGPPRLEYPVIQNLNPDLVKDIPLPEVATVYLNRPYSPIDAEILKKGDSVKTGQRVPADNNGLYFISPVTGTVSTIEEYTGYLGISYTAISIKRNGEEQSDEGIKAIAGQVSVENALKYLACLPGCPDFGSFLNRKTPFDTIVVEGVDNDLLITTNQFSVENSNEDFQEGLKILRELTGAGQIIVTCFPDSIFSPSDKNISVIEVEPVYPEAFPQLIMKKTLKKIVPAGKTSEDLGVGFIKAEAVSALAAAFTRGDAPIEKIITVTDKSGTLKNARVRIGTPLKTILDALNISAEHGDRVVFGGPLNGKSVYSENAPVLYDTDAVVLQAGADIAVTSDNPCINCGECIRACPANIPVNMLIRLLENSLYEEAVREYNLLSCIECGLCAYVCVAQIPVFHYIMLGKNEYLKLQSMEESNA